MAYFNKVNVQEEVFSIIYGDGIVDFVLPKKFRIDGFHIFSVNYKSKKKKVHYTVEGYPDWASSNDVYQTVFYKKDIDLNDMHMQETNEILTKKQILKLQTSDSLEIQCPSGIWLDVNECPEKLIKKALKKSNYHLFRKLTS